jgi:acetyl esterase/lipase
MPLDGEIAALLSLLRGLPALEGMTPAAARAVVDSMRQGSPPGPDLPSVVDRRISATGPLNVRVYRPVERPAGVIVYYHGGGWVLGSLDSSDAQLRAFARQTQCCIVAVDYRLAPEHPFPAAVVDALEALNWADASLVDLAGARVPLIVAGDSAGANLATVAAIQARDSGGPPLAGQLLYYPVTDAVLDTPSYIANAEGYFLTRDLMRWFWNHYVPDAAQRADSRCAPLRTADLSRLPPALIQTAEFDPLLDEGEAYAQRLRAAGTTATLQRRAGLIHGYVGMGPAARVAREAIDDAAAWVRTIVASAAG